MGTFQYFFGYQEKFYEYHFITSKDPDDLIGFYGSEDFMEIFCVMPFVGSVMMRGGTFDDEGNVHSVGFPGNLEVSMVFSDDSEDGEGALRWFNKRERFKDTLFGFKMWDMIQNFGFHQLPDGTCVVYHYGEYFSGWCPPFSMIVYTIFRVHARWVAWATEHHIKHNAFVSSTDEEEADEAESRQNMILHLIKHNLWKDTKAMLGFGKAETVGEPGEDPSFLTKRKPAFDTTDFRRQQKKILAQVAVDIELDRKAELPAPVSEKHDLRRSTSKIGDAPYLLANQAALSKKSLRRTSSPKASKLTRASARLE